MRCVVVTPDDRFARAALGYGPDDDPAMVRTHIRNLRGKCAAAGLPPVVITASRQGYRLTGVVAGPPVRTAE